MIVVGYRFEIFRILNLDLTTRSTQSTVPFKTLDEVRGMVKLFLSSLPKGIFMAVDIDPRYAAALRFGTIASECDKLIDAMLASKTVGVIVNTQHTTKEITMYDIISIVPLLDYAPDACVLRRTCTPCNCICGQPENPDGSRVCVVYGKYF